MRRAIIGHCLIGLLWYNFLPFNYSFADTSGNPSDKVWQHTSHSMTRSDHRDSFTGTEFVFVKSGCFIMGDTFGDGYFAEGPVHQVCLDDFYIGRYEVTQGQWKAIMGNSPAYPDHKDNYPVGSVSYDDVQRFIANLNQMTGQKYRLPTEAEWEYACRSGGGKERYAGFSNTNDLFRYANFCDVNCQHDWTAGDQDNGYTHAAPVGTYKPNGLGLYDMSGNVWEWVADWFGSQYYDESPINNPQGSDAGSERVIRGGCWLSGPWYPRCSYRFSFTPSSGEEDIGFRLAKGK
jgi:formylglycine-generating enzyme